MWRCDNGNGFRGPRISSYAPIVVHAKSEGTVGVGMGIRSWWCREPASLVALLVKNPPAVQDSWVRKFPWRRDRLPTPVFLCFPCGSNCKESPCNAGNLGLIPGLGRSPGGGHGNPLQCSCLENPMDRGAIVRGVAKSWVWLSTQAQHSLERQERNEDPSQASASAWRRHQCRGVQLSRETRVGLRFMWETDQREPAIEALGSGNFRHQ